MPDYNKGCIYKIKRIDDFNDDNIYIGSTCNFTRRKCEHKRACCNEDNIKYNFPLYKYIRDNGGWDNFIMIIIFPFKCNCKYELEVEERRVIDELEAKLNCKIPTRTQDERFSDPEYRVKVNERRKELYNINKEEMRGYYHANKHIINAPIECDNCGRVVVNSSLNRHKKTNYCINYKKND